jgi:hypothetical protein
MLSFSDWLRAKEGITIKEIVRRTGLVRRVLRGQRLDVFRVRESSLEPHLEWLDAQWAVGQRNGTELWRQLKKQGFRGCLRVVTEWASRRRRAERAEGALSRTPSSRTIPRLMTIGRDGLSKAETVTVATIENGIPLLVEAREIVAAFQAMIRMKCVADLEPWLERARTSLVASFANGVIKDQAAVAAAITSPWSNGQTEGQITKLKLVNPPKLYSRREALADQDIRRRYDVATDQEKGSGLPLQEWSDFESDRYRDEITFEENPLGREPHFRCGFAYHYFTANHLNMRVAPCCYLSPSVPGFEPVVFDGTRDFMEYWNSPAYQALRQSLRDGPLYKTCKTCPNQGRFDF